jgi:hypothetical protein
MSNSTADRCPACITENPIFVPRKRALSREYYVRVIWPDGHAMRIGKFSKKPDADMWIRKMSAEWLASQRI